MAGEYVFGEKHREYMRRAYHSTVNVAEGAVRAGKTIDNVFVFAALLENSQDKFHLATGSTLGNAKLNIGDCNGLGLEHIFGKRCRWIKYRGNDAMAVDAAAGERIIIFAGGRNSDSYKRIRGNSYGMWIATEINLHSPSFIEEALNRQLAARDRRIFWDLNPTSPKAWIYTEHIDRYAEMARGGGVGENFYNYAHFTIFDNPVMTKERLDEIAAQYDKGTVWYRRDILGERCAAQGLIYRRFADSPGDYTLPGIAPTDVDFINVGVDFGGNRSKTTFVAVGFRKVGGVLSFTALSEHAIPGEKGEIDPEKINSDAAEFLVMLHRLYPGIPVRYIFADSEAQYLINGLRRHLGRLGEGAVVCDCAKKPIVDRISFLNQLIAQGRFHVLACCPRLREGICGAAWGEDERRLDNFTSDIDILDALEYAIERYM
ncbi:MAG: PBSX family phage terminase large subunit [Eubacteriales bacterium]